MTELQRLKNISVPKGKIDVVVDTDANSVCEWEIDDLFALAYLFGSEKISVQAIYGSPVSNEEHMKQRIEGISNILKYCGRKELLNKIYKGSYGYLKNEVTPLRTEAALDLAERAKNYSPENPLYVIAIAPITNIASAILLEPSIVENIVIVWLGGHAYDYKDTAECNLERDMAASRIIFGSGAPIVQIPCMEVASKFVVSCKEIEKMLMGVNTIGNYLVDSMKFLMRQNYENGSRVLWDVTTIGWLLNENSKFMTSRIVSSPMPGYDRKYSFPENMHNISCVECINTELLKKDMFDKIKSI